jgi:hypothetical protein
MRFRHIVVNYSIRTHVKAAEVYFIAMKNLLELKRL